MGRGRGRGLFPQSFQNMLRPKTQRYKHITDTSDSLIQPLLNNNDNQFMEEKENHDDIQGFLEKFSALDKEIGDLKSNISRFESKLQSKGKEGNNQHEAITTLEGKVEKLKNQLDDNVSARKKETTKQGGAILKIEENNSNLEKKVAELETRVNEMTSSMVDMKVVTSELQDKCSSNSQDARAKMLLKICVYLIVFFVTFIIGQNMSSLYLLISG